MCYEIDILSFYLWFTNLPYTILIFQCDEEEVLGNNFCHTQIRVHAHFNGTVSIQALFVHYNFRYVIL